MLPNVPKHADHHNFTVQCGVSALGLRIQIALRVWFVCIQQVHIGWRKNNVIDCLTLSYRTLYSWNFEGDIR